MPNELAPRGETAIYGESLWANFVAEQLKFELFEPPLDWLSTLPHQLPRRKVEFCTLEAARQKSFPIFLKPAGEKEFEARVYASPDDLPADESQQLQPVLRSEVVNWEVEYRCFVREGRVETASSYWRGEVSTRDENGTYPSPPDELNAATELVEQLLRHQEHGFSFGSRGVVVDVGLIRGADWAVIEANPAFASGIYGCDPQKVLSVVASCLSR